MNELEENSTQKIAEIVFHSPKRDVSAEKSFPVFVVDAKVKGFQPCSGFVYPFYVQQS